MNSRGRDMWGDNIKPIVMILAAMATWVVSMIFFVVGFSFGSQMYFGNYDVAFPLAITTGLILTAIELAWNEEKEDILDWAIWLFAYGLGIASNYYGLTLILGMADPNVEKIIAGLLGALIEIAPERMLIRGMRNLNIHIDLRGMLRSLNGFGKKKPQNQFRPQNEPTFRNAETQKPNGPKVSHRPGNFPGPSDFLGGK